MEQTDWLMPPQIPEHAVWVQNTLGHSAHEVQGDTINESKEVQVLPLSKTDVDEVGWLAGWLAGWLVGWFNLMRFSKR